MPEEAKPATSGTTCPECVGVRLHVYKSVRKGEGLSYRYRECAACGYRVMQREQTVTMGKPFVIRKSGRCRPKNAHSADSTIPASAE